MIWVVCFVFWGFYLVNFLMIINEWLFCYIILINYMILFNKSRMKINGVILYKNICNYLICLFVLIYVFVLE